MLTTSLLSRVKAVNVLVVEWDVVGVEQSCRPVLAGPWPGGEGHRMHQGGLSLLAE